MERSLVLALLCLFWISACSNTQSQEVAPNAASPAFESPLEHRSSMNTDTGRVETDRTFEDLVASYERPDRSDWQKPLSVLPFLGEHLADKIIAEIGAGSGYFTFRIVPFAEKVIAIDIDERMLQFIDSCALIYLPDSMQKRIETRKAKADDPMLQTHEADVVFLSNTYAFIEDRVTYFRKLRDKIKPEGRLVIVDYKRRRLPVGPEASYKVPLYQVEEELTKAGYTEAYANDQLLPYQYILVAVPE